MTCDLTNVKKREHEQGDDEVSREHCETNNFDISQRPRILSFNGMTSNFVFFSSTKVIAEHTSWWLFSILFLFLIAPRVEGIKKTKKNTLLNPLYCRVENIYYLFDTFRKRVPNRSIGKTNYSLPVSKCIEFAKILSSPQSISDQQRLF